MLVAIRDADDGRLSDTELLTTAVALLTAGYLTTANALSIGVIKLLEVNGLTDLADDQEAVARAVEEMLRHAGLGTWGAADQEDPRRAPVGYRGRAAARPPRRVLPAVARPRARRRLLAASEPAPPR